MPVSKFFVVATAGKTVDGREITPAQIDQMAASYDPQRYAARVWMEHYRSFLPDSPFRAYGDVVAVKTGTDSANNRVLLAQIDATQDLVKINSDRQKLFWSIEMDPNFTGTGKAYLSGLASTDSPASLGTEQLKFAIASDKAPDQVKAHLFSSAVESPLELETPKDTGPSILSKVKDLLSGRGKADDARFTEMGQAVTAVAEEVSALKGASNFAQASEVKALSDQVTALKTELADLTVKLSGTPLNPQRSPATGGDATMTDC